MTTAPGTGRGAATGIRPPTLHTIRAAIEANVATAKARSRAQLMAVVKADGYGHGALSVALAALRAGARWLGTTDIGEAVALREAGVSAPILTWLHPSGIDAEVAASSRIDVAVGSVEELRALLETPVQPALRVHLHVDTGMSRGGSPASEWEDLLGLARDGQRRGRMRVVGLMGHLPLADDADPRANAAAIARLRAAETMLTGAGFAPPLTHLAATSGTLTDPATHMRMVRFGAGLVGIDPSGSTDLCGASRLTASIVHSATVDARTPIGYGSTYVTDRTTRVSVLPLGYADGIPREISPDAYVEVGGQRCPVLGRVSMDQIVIDTGATQFPRGTTATVFGPRDGLTPTIHDWARWSGTIPHTIVTRIGTRVRRATA